ncbi:carbohydrate ABC transporter membrane protein 2 (CUT1 family) [Paenibacillus taihuensis]|uniref:Carbohydrate ABC transporter membrane protein 2 (CUT1 family) n=1 Tax=Paenibacillus taihuensis TaxID=1156355 RepID=A0A3D9R3B3_9BACL|nr:carbohydrate ABC transporter permease [Paenibacillus taihuensis]REE70499.1 carbohydrate ABC transporter membrane protein 2 (CUT1 family) [Paenibacillus taihuensis]
MKSYDRGILSRYDLQRTPNKIVYGIMLLVITLMVCSMLYPILVTLFNSFKNNVEVNSFPPHFLPQKWDFTTFSKGWHYIKLPLFFRNTMIIFAGNMFMTVIVLGLASFSLSRLNLPGGRAIGFFFLAALFIPPTTYIIPNFVNLKNLGMLGTFQAFWLPAGANAFFLLLLKNFFDGISMELFEAGRMDGASDLRLFLRIALPLSVPIFSTLAIFVFSTAWNDWFWPSMVMHTDQKRPLATAIYNYVINVRRLDTNVKFAMLTMVMLPPIAVFLFFQRFIIRGLHMCGVKG